MDANTPITLATARYSDRDGAVNDFKAVWDARKGGEFDHTAVAVLTKDESGKLQVERHDSTAKHLTWGGAILGAALTVVAPPVGASMLAGAGAVGGAGALVGHFHHNIPKSGRGGGWRPARVGAVRSDRGGRQPQGRRHPAAAGQRREDEDPQHDLGGSRRRDQLGAGQRQEERD